MIALQVVTGIPELLFSGVSEEDLLRRLFMGKRMLQDALEEFALVGGLPERGVSARRIGEISDLPFGGG